MPNHFRASGYRITNAISNYFPSQLSDLFGFGLPVGTERYNEFRYNECYLYFDEGIILFFKARARSSLALRDDIPEVIKEDLTTFNTEHIDKVIRLYARPIGHMTPAQGAESSKGRADLTSIIMAEYIIIAYELCIADKAGAVMEETCAHDIIDMLEVCAPW